ncbi:MAG: hypothetical protein CL840_07405 [Crocinitomicaceae bacterium]|nr:hypothetical protein [Crocinitomicaceae bacterium]|tara:strand:- start:12027 stop:13805 length:1779 start_codon:yes stop_codon:yes gene_type:complete
MPGFKIKYPLFILILLVGLVSFGQKFTATVNLNTVTVGQQFKLTYTLNTNGTNFRHAGFQDFQVLAGPHQQHGMQDINGVVTKSFSLTYVLAATKEGKFTIPAMVCTVDGKNVASNTVTIQVLGKTEAQKQLEKQHQEDVFIKLFVSNRNIYQGEQVVVTYKMYTRLDIVDISPDKMPAFNGFFSQEFNSKQYFNFQPENLNGVRYHSALIKQAVLSPQRSGELLIDAYTMDIMVQIRENRHPRSIQEQLFGTFKNEKMKLKSNVVKLNVKPLPSQGKPTSFKGSVGNYKLESSVDKQQVNTNDAINLKVDISGNGNLKLIKNPEFDFPPDFEVYDPKEKANISTTAGGVSGNKSFEYLIIPRHSGEFVIPSVEFSYFDPKTGSYNTLRTPEYPITVGKGSGDSEEGAVAMRSVRKKDVALLGRDIRYIKKGKANLMEAGSVFFGSRLFWLLIVIPLIVFAGLLVIRKRLREMQADVVGMRRKKAGKIASKHLATAKKHLEAGEQNEFYEEVFRSLHAYVGNKLNIPVSELDKDTIADALAQNQVDSDIIDSFKTILGECEMARYAPSAAMNEKELFDKASDVINKIEGGLK